MSTITIEGSDEAVRPILVRQTCAALPRLPEAAREALAATCRNGGDPTLIGLPALRRVEVRAAAGPTAPADRLRVCFWNAERGRGRERLAAFLRATGADAFLLCELDHGMARTGQAHIAAETAAALGQGYAFGVEFIELGLGNRRESAAHAGARNESGYHGNAILAAQRLASPALVRLPGDGGWFTGRRQERRIGSRIAVLATVEVAGRPVVLASTHLESHADPAIRAAQMTALLGAIEAYAPGLPVLIGGDLNTRTASKDALRERSGREALFRRDPSRFADPAAHEPLFAAALAAGYEWRACNDGAPTERPGGSGSDAPRFRLDWFLARGLRCSGAAVLPALAADGTALSDHDAILVEIAPV